MLNLDTRIPLMAQERDYGRGFDMMQKAQENQLRLQALRDEYNAAKEERDRQKAIRQGMASELQKMKQGTPAQYRTTFPQTIPTGQMPQGMTGVLASERGQKLPQPALFGENILQGNFDINRELVSPAIAPKRPDIKDVLTAQFNAAVANNDVATAFDAKKKLVELEKSPIKWGMNPQKGINPATGLPDTFVTNESGELRFLNVSPYEEPKEQKAPIIWKVGKGRTEETWGYDAKGNQVLLGVQSLDAPRIEKPAPVKKPDPIDTKIKQKMVNDATVFTRDYSTVKPIIKQAQLAVKNLPPDMIQTYLQSKLSGTPLNKYFGNPEQQLAIRNLDMVMENIRLLADKPVGNLTMGEQQMVGKSVGIITDLNSSKEQKIDAVNTLANIYEAKEAMHKNVLKKFGKEDFNLFTETSKYTLSATPEQKQQYEDAIKRANGNQEQIKQINFIAKKQGVIK